MLQTMIDLDQSTYSILQSIGVISLTVTCVHVANMDLQKGGYVEMSYLQIRPEAINSIMHFHICYT